MKTDLAKGSYSNAATGRSAGGERILVTCPNSKLTTGLSPPVLYVGDGSDLDEDDVGARCAEG